MTRHVTLISPPQVFTKYQITAGVVPPLGILYLAAYLKKSGVETKIIDSIGEAYAQYSPFENGLALRGLTFAEIIKAIPEHTDVIGISVLYSSAHLTVKALIKQIKARFPDKKIVLGGAHVSVLPQFVLEDTRADIVVIGEGEPTFLDLVKNLDQPENIKGIAYKKGGQVVINEPRQLIKELDDLPFPDRSQINLENYFKAYEPHGCSSSGRWTTILSSRGCPYSCTFCTTPLIWQRRWRSRSVRSVIREMIELNEKHGIIDFHFEDENIGFRKEWLHEFCDTLIAKKLNFTWQPSNGLRVETVLDPGLMEKMKQSGCSLVVFSLESASERVRNQIIKKNLDIKNITKAVALAKKLDLKSTCYFIIGLPGEKPAEARATIRHASYLARKGLDECVIALFSMLPGCDLFNDLYQQGKIKLDAAFFQELLAMGDLTLFKSWTEHISDTELKKMRARGYLAFTLNKALFNPLKIVRSVVNILRGTDQLKSERVVRTFIKSRIRKKQPR